MESDTMTAVESLHALRQARLQDVDVRPEEIEILDQVSSCEPEIGSLQTAGVLALVESILKSPRRLDRSIRDSGLQPALIPRLLAISLMSFTLFGGALAIV